MKWPNHGGRVFETCGILFMVVPIDEVSPAKGDQVRLEQDDGSFKWFVVVQHYEDDNLEWFGVRPATLWERLFG